MTADLVVWLTQILDEDQATAERGPGLASVPSLEYFETDEYIGIEANSRWLLADIAAKRAIIALHTGNGVGGGLPWCRSCGVMSPCDTLRLLASAYVARPGYDYDGWRP